MEYWDKRYLIGFCFQYLLCLLSVSTFNYRTGTANSAHFAMLMECGLPSKSLFSSCYLSL